MKTPPAHAKPNTKPYLVQAYRHGNFVVWYLDSRWATLEEAETAAVKLHTDWGRKVRVVDEEERVLFQMPKSRLGRNQYA